MDRGKAVLPWPVARGPSGATGMVAVVVVVFWLVVCWYLVDSTVCSDLLDGSGIQDRVAIRIIK
jgi:hypothetical protein